MTSESAPLSSHNEPLNSVLGVPALVVSGFLGAGKTTLVKHLIADAQQQGLKLAVVSNEFGELGIDRALLQEAGGNWVLIGRCFRKPGGLGMWSWKAAVSVVN
jgi:hypothetical protein